MEELHGVRSFVGGLPSTTGLTAEVVAGHQPDGQLGF